MPSTALPSGPLNPEQMARDVPTADVPPLAGPADDAICPWCGGAKSPGARRCGRCARLGRTSTAVARVEAPEQWEPAPKNQFRVYCVMCGRSSEVFSATARPGRCTACGGTQLTETL